MELASLYNQNKLPPPTFLFVMMEVRKNLQDGQRIRVSRGSSVALAPHPLPTFMRQPVSSALWRVCWSRAAEALQAWIKGGAGGLANLYNIEYVATPLGRGTVPASTGQPAMHKPLAVPIEEPCLSLVGQVFKAVEGVVHNTLREGLQEEVAAASGGKGPSEETWEGRLALARALWEAVCSRRHLRLVQERRLVSKLQESGVPLEVRSAHPRDMQETWRHWSRASS